MRLVGIALFVAWLLAWAAAPKGELVRPTSTVGGLAIAGSDVTAVAWLEVSHARPRSREVLHVATIDGSDEVTPRLHLEGHEGLAYRLADAGGGRFVLVSEHRTRMDRWFEARRFGGDLAERLPDLRATFNASSWDVAASGSRLALTEEEAGGATSVHLLAEEGQWLASQAASRTLLGSGHGQLVRYEAGRRDDLVEILPDVGSAWMMRISHPRCTFPSPAPPQPGGGAPPEIAPDAREKVVSVVGLPGGYARMARLGRWLCVDGMRSGSYFKLDPVPLGDVVEPRLVSDPDAPARLSLIDANDTKGSLFLQRLEGVAPGEWSFAWGPRPRTLAGSDGLHGYAIFNVSSSAAALLTRVVGGQTQVLFERFPIQHPRGTVIDDPQYLAKGPAPVSESTVMLGPARHHLPDHRPILRALAVLPILALAIGLAGLGRLFARLLRLKPAPATSLLAREHEAVEATLALDADAPAGALRLRRAGEPILLFIEGADVLRASDVRPRSNPRGDAVDGAWGAPIVASGRFQRGSAFRADDSLHAGRGDLVLVGCTLAEARTRIATRLAGAAALFGAVLASILLLAG